MDFVIQFFGGPQDGATLALPEPAWRYVFPVMTITKTWTDDWGDPGESGVIRKAVYSYESANGRSIRKFVFRGYET